MGRDRDDQASACLAHPLDHHFHLNHHFGDNDKKVPNGTTKDWSSLYRHSKDDDPSRSGATCSSATGVRSRTAAQGGLAARLGRDRSGGGRNRGLAALLGHAGLARLALFCLLLLPVALHRLDAELCRGLVEHDGPPAGQSVCQLGQLVPQAVQLAVAEQRLSPGAPLGSEMALDQMHQAARSSFGLRLLENGTRMIKGPHMLIFLEMVERTEAALGQRTASVAR